MAVRNNTGKGKDIDLKESSGNDKNAFIRYEEGAERYRMSKNTFIKLANDAHAVYKINQICIVSVGIFEEYLETFRV